MLHIPITDLDLPELQPYRTLRRQEEHYRQRIFVVEGEVWLHTDEGEQRLGPGMCAGFPAGIANGHHLVNRGDHPVRYLEISNRHPEDSASYPDDDLAYRKAPDGKPIFTRKDGTAF